MAARRKTAEERLAKLDQKKKQLEARAQRERQKLRQAERKADTRRKVALGGALIAAARDDQRVARYLKALIEHMPDRDKRVFDGWEMPEPTPENDGGDQSTDSPSASTISGATQDTH